MIFFVANVSNIFEEEEEEEEVDGDIDDALLGELTDDVAGDDELLEAELDPLLKSTLADPVEIPEEEDPLKEGVKVFEDDEEEEVDDYDSFDDEDEM